MVSIARGRWALSPLPGDPDVQRWAVVRDGARHGHRRWIEALGEDADARGILTEAVRAAPFRAYLWELPVVQPGDEMVEAELALTDSPALGRSRADPSAFAEAFGATTGSMATFANLRRDAMLIAPHPAHTADAAHLAAFVRGAPEVTVDALWIAVADAVSDWLATRAGPVWVSTSGLAVPWLHVRLDSTPKYYSYRAYTSPRRQI